MTAVPHAVPSLHVTRPYWVVDDVSTRIAALVILRAVGEDGQPLDGVRAECERDGTATRGYEGGYVVVVGRPDRVFPGLANGPDALTIHLSAPRREVLSLPVSVPPNAVLPLRLGDIALAGLPVTLAGQVRRLNAAAPAVPGALVSCLADAAVPGLHPLALRTPLRAAVTAGTAVTPASITEAGATLSVTVPAPAGTSVLTLNSRAGLSNGVTIRIGTPDRAQLAEIAEVVPPTAGAGDVRLVRPLLVTAPDTSPVRRATVSAAGAPVNLARDARAGDGVLSLVADLAPDFATVAGETYPCGAVCDGGGYYRLPGVRGFTAVAVKATATGLAGTQPATVVTPDYRQSTATVDLGVKP